MTIKKPRSFGRGFDLLLRHCEGWEDFYTGRSRRPGKDFTFNVDLFDIGDEEDPSLRDSFLAYHVDMAENAWRLRNAFKFKVDWQMQRPGDMRHIAEEVRELSMSPPFEQCFFILENWVDEADLMLLVDTRTADEEFRIDTRGNFAVYEENGIQIGDRFVSIMPVMHRREGTRDEQTSRREPVRPLSFWPVELHYKLHGSVTEGNMGIIATPTFARATPFFTGGNGMRTDQDIHYAVSSAAYFVLWLLSRSETRRIPGLAPRNQRMGRPKGKRAFYEHHVVDIDPFAVNQVSGIPSGIQRGSPRFHAVRGFWRHYREPIRTGPNAGKTKVWIEPQWRGDKDKGVVTKDYNILRTDPTDEGNDDGIC